jgi:hypothetical protein
VKQLKKLPFFVVGSERSGTTMLRLMLEAHSMLAVTPEFEFATYPIRQGRPFPDSDALEDLSRNWIFRSLKIDYFCLDSWPKAMQNIMEIYGNKNNSTVTGAVVHKDYEELPRIFPQAKYIHIIRDPRDVAYSVVKMGWASDVVTGVNRWFEAEKSWDILKQSLDSSMVLEVHFEELVDHPDKTLAMICDFLDVPYVSQMLKYDQSSSYDKPNRAIAQAWRQRLSEKEIGTLEYILGNKLEARGYKNSGLKQRRPSFVYLKLLPLFDWIARFRHRRKMYGILLLIEDYFARKTRFSKSLTERIQQRMEAIWISNLK